jgi:protein translocase SecG subunit
VLGYLVMTLAGILPSIQVLLAVLLIASILLQQTGASLGGAFGGDNFSAGYHTRRGSERAFFWASIVLGVLLALSALLALILK